MADNESQAKKLLESHQRWRAQYLTENPDKTPSEADVLMFAADRGLISQSERDLLLKELRKPTQSDLPRRDPQSMSPGRAEPSAPEYPPAKMMREVMNRIPLSAAANEFVEWMNRQGIDRKASGAIGPRALLFFLAGWCTTQQQGLTPFFQSQFPGTSEVLVEMAIGFLEKNQLPLGVSGFPYVSKECEEVLLEAQALAKALRREEIEPHHVFAALLLRAAKDANPDGFLGMEPGRGQQLHNAFLRHIKEGGYSEAWDYWEQAFAGINAEAAYSDENQPRRNSTQSEAQKAPSDLSGQTGTRFDPRREAKGDELCLDIDAYSRAIADTFTAAAEEDDFVFALYAPWGRGKSTLIKQVARILGGGSENGEPGRGYKPIFFSAWKYPTRPEVWVHLYQKIATVAQEKGVWQELRIGLRVGLLKHGWWPLFCGFGLLALSRLQFEFAHWLFNGLGAIGLLVVGSFVWSTSTTGKRFAQSYFSTPNHAEKLGLQAVIGEDLKNLLNVWITPRTSSDTSHNKKTAAFDFTKWPARLRMVGVIFLIWAALGLVGWKLHRYSPKQGDLAVAVTDSQPSIGTNPPPVKANLELAKSGVKVTLTASENSASGDSAQPHEVNQESLILAYCVLGILGLGAGLFAVVIAWKPEQHERVFLVVDDLDRCEPDQMLAVIESLRLFLDETEMSRRLQVAMLLDRGIFKRAVLSWGRRNGMLAANVSESKLFLEQEEKLFVASLQLPLLTSTQVKQISVKLVDNEYHQQLKKELQKLPSAADIQPSPVPPGSCPSCLPSEEERSEWEQKMKAAEPRRKEIQDILRVAEPTSFLPAVSESLSEGELTFSTTEREEIKNVLSQIHPSELTPRSIRSFVIRYQLLRLLLRQLNHKPHPQGTISGLAKRLHPEADLPAVKLPVITLSAIKAVAGCDDESKE